MKIQPKSPEFLLDMQCFCNFSFVSLGIRPRSRQGAERIRQGEGRLSRPQKTALERSYLTWISSSANRILRPRRKKTPDRFPEKKNDHTTYIIKMKIHSSYEIEDFVETLYICLCYICSSTAWMFPFNLPVFVRTTVHFQHLCAFSVYQVPFYEH